MVKGATADEVWAKIIGIHNDLAGRPLTVLQDVYKSESDSNQRNQAIGALMFAYGYIKTNWQQAVDLYTRQCSIGVNAKDLATMAATLAFGGKNPVTGKQVMDAAKVPGVLAIMATAGLYDDSGKWLFRTGLPAKSGVGGGLIAVSPGKFGIAVISPPLDDAGQQRAGAEGDHRHLQRPRRQPVRGEGEVVRVHPRALTTSSCWRRQGRSEDVISVRIEHDLLGNKEVPADAYYGVQAARALENFHISGVELRLYPNFIKALAMVKLADQRKGDWELFNLATDPAERKDVSAEHADKVKELVALWDELIPREQRGVAEPQHVRGAGGSTPAARAGRSGLPAADQQATVRSSQGHGGEGQALRSWPLSRHASRARGTPGAHGPDRRSPIADRPFFFGPSDDYVGSTLKTDPLFQVDAHVTRDLTEHLWTSFDVAWYTGGQASVDGVAGEKLNNLGLGFTLGYTLNENLGLTVGYKSTVNNRAPRGPWDGRVHDLARVRLASAHRGDEAAEGRAIGSSCVTGKAPRGAQSVKRAPAPDEGDFDQRPAAPDLAVHAVPVDLAAHRHRVHRRDRPELVWPSMSNAAPAAR